jgi:dihydroorotase
MPNTWPVIDSLRAAVEYLGKEINPAARVIGMKRPQLLYIGVTDSNFKEVSEFLKLPQSAGGKIYPAGEVTTGKLGIAKDSSIRWHMNNIAEAGKVLAVHCADPRVFKEKNGDTIEGEAKYLEKILKLAYPLREHLKLVICHVSCRVSAELVLQAQREGYRNLFLGVTPHHLWFDNAGTNWQPGLDPVFYKCLNGLRGPEDREFLVSLLANEGIKNIIIESDSACHTTAEKLSDKAPGGIPGNQEFVSSIITLAKQHDISEKRVADLICFNPARLFDIKVSRERVRYRIEERTDDLRYNGGIVTNPWNGSRLWFPVGRA